MLIRLEFEDSRIVLCNVRIGRFFLSCTDGNKTRVYLDSNLEDEIRIITIIPLCLTLLQIFKKYYFIFIL